MQCSILAVAQVGGRGCRRRAALVQPAGVCCRGYGCMISRSIGIPRCQASAPHGSGSPKHCGPAAAGLGSARSGAQPSPRPAQWLGAPRSCIHLLNTLAGAQHKVVRLTRQLWHLGAVQQAYRACHGVATHRVANALHLTTQRLSTAGQTLHTRAVALGMKSVLGPHRSWLPVGTACKYYLRQLGMQRPTCRHQAGCANY